MVKKEESSGSQDTPGVLHLEPILHRENNGITGTDTTVLAIETHTDKGKAYGEEIEYGYPITCGDSSAVLLFKKFVCPGINVRCVKFNDQLISPKQFVHLAGKATLKDWKRAIRLGGVMLRKMMDSGQIDFYQHYAVCSNTCRSTKFDVQISSPRLAPGTSVHPNPPCVAPDPVAVQVPLLTGDCFHDAAAAEELSEEAVCLTTETGPSPDQSSQPTTTNGHPPKRRRSDTADGVLSLWKSVADSGLMGDVLSSLQTELLTAFKGVEARSVKANLQVKDAIILNSLCEMFGLLESVKGAVELRHNLNEENKVHNHFHGLGKTLKKRRKLEKSSSFKATSSKQLRLERSLNNSLNILSSVTSPVLLPLPVVGLSPQTINPLHFSHFSECISTEQHRSPGPSLQLYDKSVRDGQKKSS